MKTTTRTSIRLVLTGGLLGLFTAGLYAQAPDRPGPRERGDRTGDRSFRTGDRGGDRGRGGERGDRMRGGLDRWLEELKAKDPDEYARLTELREKDPRGFMVALRQRLIDRRMKALEQFPKVLAAVNSLSEEDKKKFYAVFSPSSAYERRGHGGSDRDPRGHRPEDAKIKTIREQYAGVTDPSRRSQLRAEFKALLGQHYDRKMKYREDQIGKIEEHLKQLHDSIEEQRVRRDLYLEQRVAELLGANSEPNR